MAYARVVDRCWSVVFVGCALAACSSKPSGTPPALEQRRPSDATADTRCLADSLTELHADGDMRLCADPGHRAACERDCASGDGNACWNLALAQLERDDKAAADDWFGRACAAGHANGCTNHAAHLWAMDDGDASYECARRLFEKACASDDHFACGMDGRLRLDRGQGDDVERGRAILERSCISLRGFPCRILALNLERGRLGPSSPERLRSLMAEACAGGDQPACAPFTTVDGTFKEVP